MRQNRAFFLSNSLYDDGMFWYELFLFISASAERLRLDHAQAYVPAELVDRLILILAR